MDFGSKPRTNLLNYAHDHIYLKISQIYLIEIYNLFYKNYKIIKKYCLILL